MNLSLVFKDIVLIDDVSYKEHTQTCIYCTQKIDLFISNCIFDNCSGNYTGPVYTYTNTLRVSRVCCYRCSGATISTIYSKSETVCCDTSCCFCSLEKPANDDIFNVQNDCFLKRLNFSQNWAFSSGSFQCYKSSIFLVSYTICSRIRGGSISELSNTIGGFVDNLVLFDNVYTSYGINVNGEGSTKIASFDKCFFIKNEGSQTFIRPIESNLITFRDCFYDGEKDFGVDATGILKKTTRVPDLDAGVSTYECHGVYHRIPSCKRLVLSGKYIIACSIHWIASTYCLFNNEDITCTSSN